MQASHDLDGHIPRSAMLLVLLLLSAVLCSEARFRCRQQGVATRSARFHFAGACVRSKMSLVGASYADTLEQCAQFANKRRGLAINFLNRELLYPLARNYSRETCLVFDCPEFDVQMSLEIDSLYDYYSTYARPMPNHNVTCIPRLGVFQVHSERLNFTDAQEVCETENGNLADISNGPRTFHIASVLLKEHVRTAYIGLAQDEGRFITTEGILLECLPYRAWAPGQPRQGHKCAALTDKGFWISYDCKKRLPFVCELKQSGPLRPCMNLPNGLRRTCRETFIRSFPTSRRWPQCGDPQIDENTFRLQLEVKNETSTNKNKTDNVKDRKRANSQRKMPN